MAHNITDTDALFSVRELPWHGLGTVLADYPTRAEAQQLAHPWEPVSEPVYRRTVTVGPDGPESGFAEVEGRKLLVRSDNDAVLGDVSDSLGVITNDELWDVAEAVGGSEAGIKIETAGSLDAGRKVWILLRLDEPIRVKGDPNGETLAMFSLQNAHDGTGAFRGQAHNVRIVCANTSAAADASTKRTGHEFTFRHSSKVAERIAEAKAAVALWRSEVEVWQTAMEALVGVRVTGPQVEDFITRFHPLPADHLVTDRVRGNVERARGELRGLLDGSAGTLDEAITGTAYGLFQAGIEWSQHYRRTRAAEGRARMEAHFRRAMVADSALRRDTLTLAREVATA